MFEWLLYWDVISNVPDFETLILGQHWSKSVWMRCLKLGIGSPACSANLVQSCLKHGADPMVTNHAGFVPLQVAMFRGCSGQVLEILSSASFAADDDLSAEAIDPSGYWLVEIIRKCSRYTVELWKSRGLNMNGITGSTVSPYYHSPLEIAKQRTKSTGDSSVEDYLRSLGTRTPPGSPAMNPKSEQLKLPDIDIKSL